MKSLQSSRKDYPFPLQGAALFLKLDQRPRLYIGTAPRFGHRFVLRDGQECLDDDGMGNYKNPSETGGLSRQKRFHLRISGTVRAFSRKHLFALSVPPEYR